jgi:hypothetical protein
VLIFSRLTSLSFRRLPMKLEVCNRRGDLLDVMVFFIGFDSSVLELFGMCSGRLWFILNPHDEPIWFDGDFFCGEFNSQRRRSFTIERESCLDSLSLILTYKL